MLKFMSNIAKIFVVVFFNVAVKCILGHLPRNRKGWVIDKNNPTFVVISD